MQDGVLSFDDSASRRDRMRGSIDAWLAELTKGVNEARASDVFQEWLDVQSQFHDYSARNTLLIQLQCPEATTVAGYRTWQTEFDRHVREGESAIWIWAPIITNKCPACGNSPSYHETAACEYDETRPDDWETGLVGFRPAPVFDVSQTEGEPLPALETAAIGDGEAVVDALRAAAGELGARVEIIPEHDWTRGGASGVCRYLEDGGPEIEVVNRENAADVARTLIHEYAHALLHSGGSEAERAKREVEAESVAYVAGRACGLDMSGSAFYLAAWADDDVPTIRERVDRISRTAGRILDVIPDAYQVGE